MLVRLTLFTDILFGCTFSEMKRIIFISSIGLTGVCVLLIFLFKPVPEKTSEIQMSEGQIPKNFQSGDIIFQTSKSDQSLAIQLATKSEYSHMGIVYEDDGEFYVYEAVQPVKLTRLGDWIKRGEGSHYVVKRLRNANQLLTKERLERMRDFGNNFNGKSYDVYFEWSDEKIYCSELVWKIYKETLDIEIGELQELREFDLTSSVVKVKLKERYGKNIPLNEKVISPSRMFESTLLETVIEN